MDYLSLKIKVVIGISVISVGAIACHPTPDDRMHEAMSITSSSQDVDVAGVKLIDIVNQSPVPKHKHNPDQIEKTSIKPDYLKYVGRYHGKVDCEKTLSSCSEGVVDYVVNLREDGSAYRTIIRHGKIYVETTEHVKSYRQDYWDFDDEEQNLVIHLKEGAELFFDVDTQFNLHLNLEKTLSYDDFNRQFFSQQQFANASQSYVLTKISEP